MRTRLSGQLWKPVIALIVALLAVTVVLPAILVKQMSFDERVAPLPIESGVQEEPEAPIVIGVYLTKEDKVERVPLETYVRNVLAAEMPAEFELEALKAQAIASRTYVVKRWLDKDSTGVPEGALVTDTVAHQAYIAEDRLRQEWTDAYASRLDKLNRAVEETAGLIVTFGHEPIQASFFSTSNGFTENSEEYWRDFIPYLRSVPSPWDEELSPKYKSTVSLSLKEFASRLGIDAVSAQAGSGGMRITETTTGQRVKTIVIGGKTFTGREVREKLELNSSQFTWAVSGSNIEIETYGYGHGVGMSQWGANGLAKEGKSAADILKYYYRGVEIERLEPFLPKPLQTVKK